MVFFDKLERFGDAVALEAQGQASLSYRGLAERAGQFSTLCSPRSLAFVLCDNRMDSLVGYLGLLGARVVPALFGKALDADALALLLKQYRPLYLWLPQQRQLQENHGRVLHSLGDYVLVQTAYAQDYGLHADLALLLTTSGSTGSPMLVRQSYQNIASNARAIADYLEITQADRPITTLPMHYTYGLSILHSHLLRGCTILLNEAAVVERAFWQWLKAGRATTFGGVPYTYEMLQRMRFQTMERGSLQTLTQAGGKMDAEASRKMAQLCADKGLRFFSMYGQTEATARMSYLPPEQALAKAGSIGIAIPGGSFCLEDAQGSPIEASDVAGELVYRGDNVSMGYASCAQDLSLPDSNQGVLRTGDIALRDADGFYYIVGRKKRFLKIFGNRVNLDEVEAMVTQMGFEAACVGSDDHLKIYSPQAEQREQILAELFRKTGIHPSAMEVCFVDKLPRSESGKIRYADLGVCA